MLTFFFSGYIKEVLRHGHQPCENTSALLVLAGIYITYLKIIIKKHLLKIGKSWLILEIIIVASRKSTVT